MVYLFDIDGTLMHSAGAGMRALAIAFERLFGAPDAARGLKPAGKTDPLIAQEMFEARLGRPPAGREVEELLAAYEQLLPAELQATPNARALPGAKELVIELQRTGAPVGLCTGNTRVGAQRKLERVDLWGCFPFGGYGSDHAERAQVVQVAIDRAGQARGRPYPPCEVLVIGDTPRDIAAARAVGARVAAVATGPHSMEELATHRPDHLAASLTELAPVLLEQARPLST